MNHIYKTAHKHITKARKIVLYGAGLAALGILDLYPLPVAYLVDDTPGAAGRVLPNGLRVNTSEQLNHEIKGEVFIVISAWTQNAILKISERLRSLGFRLGVDFADCSVLHFESIRSKLLTKFNHPAELDLFSACQLWGLSCSASTISAVAGTWLFVELLRHLDGKVAGPVAECGVYQGGNAFLGLMLSPELRKRRYQLFDSFEGFPELSAVDPKSRRDHFRDTTHEGITARLAPFENVEIHKGYFRDSFKRIVDLDYSMVYIDCDLYESTLDCLDHFYPRLQKGGLLLLHDYWLPPQEQSQSLNLDLYGGVQRACLEYFGSPKMESLVIFPETTHALLVKE